MNRLVKFIQEADEKVNLAINYLAGVSALVCMVLIFSDVWGRYLLNRPLSGTLEVSELLLTIMIFGSITYLEIRYEHIKITFLFSRFSPGIQRWMDIFCRSLQVILFGFLSLETFLYFNDSWQIGEVSWGEIELPLWIPKIIIFAGCFLFFLHSLGSLLFKIFDSGEKR